MPDKKTPKEPSEIQPPDQNPEVRPEYQPEAPIAPDGDPGTVPPKLPDNPWPEKGPSPAAPQVSGLFENENEIRVWVSDGI